ncbi:MAG TPA: flagellar biosynthetic protein FliQ [Bryobacteraceae bacterium]|nr:flagellar biosynthetic protein FliQ [Bryobacteraceae bacterium]
MSVSGAVEVFRHALMTAFWLSLPLLAVGFISGIVVSLLQIITSIQDTSFGAIPRLAAFLFAMVLVMPWMLMRLITYTVALFGDFSRYAQ